ncbi:MAG: 3'-5' exonuclease, partial [Candidatus Thorarchaeota archaeon]
MVLKHINHFNYSPSSKKQEKNAFSVNGYENWFHLVPKRLIKEKFFLLDFKPHFFEEETQPSNKNSYIDEDDIFNDEEIHDDSYFQTQSKSFSSLANQVSGVTIFFLVRKNNRYEKYRSFIRYHPYFYLSMKPNLTEDQINRIIWQVEENGKGHIKKIEKINLFDTQDLVFPEKRLFIKVTTYVPNSVPILRDKLETISNVVEWREADILYHRRVAIDLDLRIGSWYEGNFKNQECIKIQKLPEIIESPQLEIFAYDIETSNPRNEQPDPNKHSITMISYFSKQSRGVLVNASIVESSNLNDFFVVTRKPNSEYSKPWIDFIPIINNILEIKDFIKIPFI